MPRRLIAFLLIAWLSCAGLVARAQTAADAAALPAGLACVAAISVADGAPDTERGFGEPRAEAVVDGQADIPALLGNGAPVVKPALRAARHAGFAYRLQRPPFLDGPQRPPC